MSFDGSEKTRRALDLVQRDGIVATEQLVRILLRGVENIEIVKGVEPARARRETPCQRGLASLSGTSHDDDRHNPEMRAKSRLKRAIWRISHHPNDNHSDHE